MTTSDLQHIQQVWDTAECLYDSSAVAQAFDSLAQGITHELQHKNPLAVSVMNGGMVCAGQLVMRLNFLFQLDFVHATRYRDTTQGVQVLEWRVYPQRPLSGRHVLLIDDILDEGRTLFELVQHCKAAGAESVHIAVLADKQHSRRDPPGFCADFTGLYIEDRYVFGCGMDYKSYLRNVNGIYAVQDHFL